MKLEIIFRSQSNDLNSIKHSISFCHWWEIYFLIHFSIHFYKFYEFTKIKYFSTFSDFLKFFYYFSWIIYSISININKLQKNKFLYIRLGFFWYWMILLIIFKDFWLTRFVTSLSKSFSEMKWRKEKFSQVFFVVEWKFYAFSTMEKRLEFCESKENEFSIFNPDNTFFAHIKDTFSSNESRFHSFS